MFDYSDAQQSEAIAWLVLFVGFMVVGAIGCAVHGLHREYREYLKWRRTHTRWSEILKEPGK